MLCVAGRADLAAGLRVLAVNAEAGGVDRVDADVRAIGGRDDAVELRHHGFRQRQTFGEEHDALAAWQHRQAFDDRAQRVDVGKPCWSRERRSQDCS